MPRTVDNLIGGGGLHFWTHILDNFSLRTVLMNENGFVRKLSTRYCPKKFCCPLWKPWTTVFKSGQKISCNNREWKAFRLLKMFVAENSPPSIKLPTVWVITRRIDLILPEPMVLLWILISFHSISNKYRLQKFTVNGPLSLNSG